ncbi:hypothetical protein NSU_2280 [Novosphingobium pentaromativorans US6-1]|uniref:HTH lysR-type domain-containing protein n=2 Tax=Novosphingobium pentaromativorans TaxID=205844 RepID=G6ED59_9SPHN|nr:hypothetical protein NSU_2280 [Novosphingobium pentaromativorans US6-1]
MSQPPLSQSIQRLEAELGVTLLERSRRKVELTRAGKIFLEEARRTLRQADLARAMTQRAGQPIPDVRVSFIGPALYHVLPSLIVKFRSAVPDVHVRLFEHPSSRQVEGLQHGEFDVGFVTAATDRTDEFDSFIVERSRIVAAVPANGPFAEHTSVALNELAQQPFITPPQRYSIYSKDMLEMFKAVGVMPQVTQEATQTNTAISLVAAGLGCSLVPATAAVAHVRNVKYLPIIDDTVRTVAELAMIWLPKHVSERGKSFIELVRAQVDESQPPQDLDTLL